MALLIGTFWTLLRMLWLDHSCVLRQFLGKINHCWRFPMFSTQSTTVLKLLLHCNHFVRDFLLIKPLCWSPLPWGTMLVKPFFTGNKCLTQVGIYVFFIWSLFLARLVSSRGWQPRNCRQSSSQHLVIATFYRNPSWQVWWSIHSYHSYIERMLV